MPNLLKHTSETIIMSKFKGAQKLFPLLYIHFLFAVFLLEVFRGNKQLDKNPFILPTSSRMLFMSVSQNQNAANWDNVCKSPSKVSRGQRRKRGSDRKCSHC